MPNFANVEEMIAGLPGNERVIVNRLRSLIAECIPKAEEKSYYDMGVPFYRHNRLICFIWPPSVMWGKQPNEEHRRKGVSLGFSQGNLMSNEDGALLAEGRKQVYVMYFKTLKDIDENQVRALLFEASMIDEEFSKKQKKVKKKYKKKV